MLAATYDLGGQRAARLAAWCLAFEPSSIFFNTEIHKEALMELAAGLRRLRRRLALEAPRHPWDPHLRYRLRDRHRDPGLCGLVPCLRVRTSDRARVAAKHGAQGTGLVILIYAVVIAG